MKTNLFVGWFLHATRRLLVVAALSVLVSSCATQRAVEGIVARSNAALLAGATGDIFANPGGGAGNAATNTDWRTVVAQIEEFAAVHTNEPATVGPLRVRQAMMLLQHGQTRQARTVFDQTPLKDLHTSRDKALRLLSTNLVWWFGVPATLSSDDLKAAGYAISNLTEQIDQLNAPKEESVRDYLAVTRAWISLKLAHDYPSRAEAQRRFAETFNSYGPVLTTNELAAIAQPPEPSSRTKLDLSDYRVAWGEALLAYATNAFPKPVPFEGVTNAFRVRLQAARP